MASTVGIERIRVALLDENEKIDTSFGDNGIFDIDARTSKGATDATISGLAPQIDRIYGSNESVGVSSQGTGQVSATIGANDIPTDVVAILTGMDKDENTGAWTLDSHSKAPMAVMEFITTSESTGKDVHFAVLKGIFTHGDINAQTNNSNLQRTTDKLTFTGLNRLSDRRIFASLNESQPEVDAQTVQAFEDLVFPRANKAVPAPQPQPQPQNGGDHK